MKSCQAQESSLCCAAKRLVSNLSKPAALQTVLTSDRALAFHSLDPVNPFRVIDDVWTKNILEMSSRVHLVHSEIGGERRSQECKGY